MRPILYAILISLVLVSLINCGDNGTTTRPNNPAPVASFTESGEQVTPATIVFRNYSAFADAFFWRFGDGDTTSITHPTHTYTIHGNYAVSLTARNTANGRSNTLTKTLQITPGKLYMSAIRIDNMPFTDIHGAGWDSLSGPDVYPDLATDSGTVFTLRPYYRLDATPSDLPILWNLVQDYLITDWSPTYYVYLWDEDPLDDDFIGSTNGFRINDIISSQGYVDSVRSQNSSGTIRTMVSLRWE